MRAASSTTSEAASDSFISENLRAGLPAVAWIPDFSESAVASFAALIAHETSGGNITGQAILAEITPPKHADIIEVMAFSSARKMAGVRAKVDSAVRTLIKCSLLFVINEIYDSY